MTTNQTTRLRNSVVRIINKVGIQVTWKARSPGIDDGTGYGDKKPTWTSKTITVSLQPLTITDKVLAAGFTTQDTRNVIAKYTDVLSRGDEIIWNGVTFMVTGVQDVPAFGDATNPGSGDVIAYLVQIKSSVA